MSEKIEREEDRVRLRLSIQPGLYERLDNFAKALDLDRNSAAVFALSFGLHALDGVIHPPQKEIALVMKNHMEDELTPVMEGFKSSRQR